MDWARTGRVVESVERCVEESMIALWERLESAWSERSRECVVCDSDWGSLVVRAERGKVVNRFR